MPNTNPILITNSTNIRYLTGFVGTDARDASVMLVSDKVILFTNSLSLEYAKQLPRVDTVIATSPEKPLSKQLATVLKKEGITTLAFEESNLTVAEHTKLAKTLSGVTLVPSEGEIEKRRKIKKKEEISSIRAAASITDKCFEFILERLRPGMTEARLSWEIESFLHVQAGDIAFAPIVAFNANSSQPHYMGKSNNPLRRGSLILLDFGAKVNGYCADMTRVVFLGTPKEEWAHAYTAVLTAQQTALDLLDSGERDGKTLDQAARSSIEQANLPPYPHSLGHALGLDIHEAPRISIHKPATLEQNMVVTVEPGVYIEGQYGIRIEDLVLLRDKGIEILSKSSKTMTVL